MEKVDIHSIEQLNELYDSLNSIRKTLNDLLDLEALSISAFYDAVAKHNISTKLTEKSQIIELIKAGENKVVENYIQTSKEVSKAKNSFKQALEAVNIKKHINNISSKY